LARLWRVMSPRQRAALNSLADSILKPKAIRPGYFEARAAGVDFLIILN
jgi:hypothetical protein